MPITEAAGVRVRVLIPGLLRSYTGGAECVDLEIAVPNRRAPVTLADAVAALDARCPGLQFRIIDEQGKVRPHIRLFLDGAQARDLAARLPAACQLMIVGALSGG